MIAIGDIAARCLGFVGITKKRVSSWLGFDCGCGRRQNAMNTWGYVLQFRAMYLINHSKAWLGNAPRWKSVGRVRRSFYFLWMAVASLFGDA